MTARPQHADIEERKAFRVSRHALERYREYYPDADDARVRAAVRAAQRLSQSVANRLAGRGPSIKRNTSTYLLHTERSGMFVLDYGSLITFLRFGPSQRAVAIKLYGEGTPLTSPALVVEEPRFLGYMESDITFSNRAARLLGGRLQAFKSLMKQQVEEAGDQERAPVSRWCESVVGVVRLNGQTLQLQRTYQDQLRVGLLTSTLMSTSKTALEKAADKLRRAGWTVVPPEGK